MPLRRWKVWEQRIGWSTCSLYVGHPREAESVQRPPWASQALTRADSLAPSPAVISHQRRPKRDPVSLWRYMWDLSPIIQSQQKTYSGHIYCSFSALAEKQTAFLSCYKWSLHRTNLFSGIIFFLTVVFLNFEIQCSILKYTMCLPEIKARFHLIVI